MLDFLKAIGLLETANFLALFIPAWAAILTYGLLEGMKWPAIVRGIFAAIAAMITVVALYKLFEVSGYPAWMRWPHEWFF